MMKQTAVAVLHTAHNDCIQSVISYLFSSGCHLRGSLYVIQTLKQKMENHGALYRPFLDSKLKLKFQLEKRFCKMF